MNGSVIAFPWKYKHCTGSVKVMDHAGVLHTLVINHCDDANVTVTLYDNNAASGDVIAVIDVDNGKTHYVLPVTLLYDIQLNKGLYAAFSGQPSNSDITISYK